MKITVDFFPDRNDVEIVVAGMIGRGDDPKKITKTALRKELHAVYEGYGLNWSAGPDVGYDDEVEEWDLVSKVVNRLTGEAA